MEPRIVGMTYVVVIGFLVYVTLFVFFLYSVVRSLNEVKPNG
jgi:hypothetical protein